MNKYFALVVILSTSIMLTGCVTTDYILVNRDGGGSISGNNETGYSIHACGGVDCETGYYSIAS